MQPSKVKFLFILAIAIYGCASPNNTNISNSQVSVISSPSINQRENTIPSNTSTPVKSKETATPVKQLSALEIKSITDSGIVGANNQFAFDIFSDLVKKDSKKIFLSLQLVYLLL